MIILHIHSFFDFKIIKKIARNKKKNEKGVVCRIALALISYFGFFPLWFAIRITVSLKNPKTKNIQISKNLFKKELFLINLDFRRENFSNLFFK
jgi:hypothetical protein